MWCALLSSKCLVSTCRSVAASVLTTERLLAPWSGSPGRLLRTCLTSSSQSREQVLDARNDALRAQDAGTDPNDIGFRCRSLHCRRRRGRSLLACALAWLKATVGRAVPPTVSLTPVKRERVVASAADARALDGSVNVVVGVVRSHAHVHGLVECVAAGAAAQSAAAALDWMSDCELHRCRVRE